MTKTVLALLILAAAALGQPTVTATTTITATAGTLVCTGTPGVVDGISTMRLVCKAGTATLHTSDSTVPSTPGTGIVVSVSSGANAITLLLTKGNPAPDGWQVAATDGTATQTKSGQF